ncbi:MAG: SDR family NAD(P)-dependent oxidoreductase, partial [Flavisolibacter sp.]|nr:SDR family NAD(P)-dependent oxidoreductase [Flavisolibacter sp.]
MRDRLFDLNGKVALITGASSGMGRAIAEAMAEQGATIVLSSNDEQGCKQVTEDLNKKNYAAHYVVCDVAKKEEIENLYNKTISRAGKIDILVSCVGVAIPGSLLDINAEDFEKTFAINLQSAIYLTKLVIPPMAERN